MPQVPGLRAICDMKFFTREGRQDITDFLWTQGGSLFATDSEAVDGLYREIMPDNEWRIEAGRFYEFAPPVVDIAIELAQRCTSHGPCVIDADRLAELVPPTLPRADEALAYLVEGGMFRRG